MARMKAENLHNDVRSRIIVSSPGQMAVAGFVTQPLSIDGQAMYNTPLYSASVEGIQDMQNRAKAIPGIGQFVPQPSPVSPEMTIAAWTGTAKPTFTIHMTFIALTENYDVRAKVLQLYKGVYPTGSKVLAGTFLTAPLGYKVVNLVASGVSVIKIGTWFQAVDQIIKDVNFTFSKQVLANGRPLYAEGTFTCEPYRLITFDEFSGYFLNQGTP